MLNFGKYKGKTLFQVINNDRWYVMWMANNIPNINDRLDDEDKQTLFKFALPYKYLAYKYGNIWKMSEESIIRILRSEGYLNSAYSYEDANHYDGLSSTIKTFYGSTYGIAWGSRGKSISSIPLIPLIREHLDEAEKWFEKYIKMEAEIELENVIQCSKKR